MGAMAKRFGLGARETGDAPHDSTVEGGAQAAASAAEATAATERLYAVLVEPHITEKATQLGEASNQYAFKVAKSATKREIRVAVETLFGVKVEGVTTLNVKGRSKRNFRGVVSRKKAWKKAYVRLAAGEDLDYAAVET